MSTFCARTSSFPLASACVWKSIASSSTPIRSRAYARSSSGTAAVAVGASASAVPPTATRRRGGAAQPGRTAPAPALPWQETISKRMRLGDAMAYARGVDDLRAADVMLRRPKTCRSRRRSARCASCSRTRASSSFSSHPGRSSAARSPTIPAGAPASASAIDYAEPDPDTIGPNEPATVAFERTASNPHRRVVVHRRRRGAARARVPRRDPHPLLRHPRGQARPLASLAPCRPRTRPAGASSPYPSACACSGSSTASCSGRTSRCRCS